ncbi:hypothetical protein [Parafrankia sp. BMG5.11]|uniref:hypothetical protein n=1 Tax=Parafrankia sp. BMG5.11 TaxID=222540 RepID=UPI001404B1C2|nr:hypothetical protein [Parafrankia sp. BMG5.11]
MPDLIDFEVMAERLHFAALNASEVNERVVLTAYSQRYAQWAREERELARTDARR